MLKNYAILWNNMKKFILFILSFISLSVSVFADSYSSLENLRDLLYAQELNAEQILPYYIKTVSEIQKEFPDDKKTLNALLARAEYFMGRTYQLYEQKENAITHYEKGVECAELSLSVQENPLAYLMKSECISQMCAIKPTSYAIANGLKVGSLADDVLSLDEFNTAAIYLKASRWIYAPQIFADQKKGRKILLENMKYLNPKDKDDVFNFNLALGYSFLCSKLKDDALVYLNKALEVYPTNKFCISLISDANE